MSGNNVFDGLFASPGRQNTHTVRAGKRCSRLFTEKKVISLTQNTGRPWKSIPGSRFLYTYRIHRPTSDKKGQ